MERPRVRGVLPHLPPNVTTEDKKRAISDFIQKEKGIKTTEIVKELLKGQFLKAIDEDYVIKRKEEMREYNGCARSSNM